MLCKINYTKTRHRFMRAVLLVLALIAVNLAGAWANVPVGLAAPPLIWTVTNTSDGGAGSLRDAISGANLNGTAGTIRFRIRPGGARTILVGSGGNGALPAINVPVVIDGATQSGCAGHPCIILDGTSAGSVSFAVTTTHAFARGSAIKATATDPAGNTSEFSNCKTAS